MNDNESRREFLERALKDDQLPVYVVKEIIHETLGNKDWKELISKGMDLAFIMGISVIIEQFLVSLK